VSLLQVHWVFGSKLVNSSVTLANASLELMHEAPPPGAAPAAWSMKLHAALQQVHGQML
jgi:hypothetical protein